MLEKIKNMKLILVYKCDLIVSDSFNIFKGIR